jgi:hypothetical protein
MNNSCADSFAEFPLAGCFCDFYLGAVRSRVAATRRAATGGYWRPCHKLIGFVEQPFQPAPKDEAYGEALLLGAEERKGSCSLEGGPIVVVNPEAGMLSVTIPDISPSQNTPALPNLRLTVTRRPSGANCSCRRMQTVAEII